MGTREGVGEASVAVRVGRANEHRKLLDRKCRDCSPGRRQHRLDRQGEGQPGSAVSKNSGTHVHLVSGPGRACSDPGESRGLVGKEKPVPHEEKEEAIGFIHSSDEAGEQGEATLCGVGGAKGWNQGESRTTKARPGRRAGTTVTQAGVGYGRGRARPSLPEVGAVCLNGHARICAGGAGQPASLPRLPVPRCGPPIRDRVRVRRIGLLISGPGQKLGLAHFQLPF